jgi:DNA replication licensing factor MCM4
VLITLISDFHTHDKTLYAVVENIQLPPTLLSRFDLIYLVLDQGTPALDRQLAAHLASAASRFLNQSSN